MDENQFREVSSKDIMKDVELLHNHSSSHRLVADYARGGVQVMTTDQYSSDDLHTHRDINKQPLPRRDLTDSEPDDGISLSELLGTYLVYSKTSLRMLAQKTGIRRSLLQKIMLDKKTATPAETTTILDVIQHSSATE